MIASETKIITFISHTKAIRTKLYPQGHPARKLAQSFKLFKEPLSIIRSCKPKQSFTRSGIKDVYCGLALKRRLGIYVERMTFLSFTSPSLVVTWLEFS